MMFRAGVFLVFIILCGCGRNVYFTSDPSGATVSVGGRSGTTPVRLYVPGWYNTAIVFHQDAGTRTIDLNAELGVFSKWDYVPGLLTGVLAVFGVSAGMAKQDPEYAAGGMGFMGITVLWVISRGDKRIHVDFTEDRRESSVPSQESDPGWRGER